MAAKDDLLSTLKARFEKHMNRHPGVKWASVEARLKGNAKGLKSLTEMERTGGEPDVVGQERSGSLAAPFRTRIAAPPFGLANDMLR